MKFKFRNKNSDSTFEIVEQLCANIYWKDRKGVLLGCNKKTLASFGLSSLDEYVGKTDYDLFPKEQADALIKVDQEVLKCNRSIITNEVVTTQTGKKVVFLSIKTPLKDKCGEVMGIVGASIDVTDIEKSKIDELFLLDSIISVMPGHVYWKSSDGRYLGCNNEQAAALGLSSRDDIKKKKSYEDLPAEYAQILQDNDNCVLNEEKTVTAEEVIVNAQGEERVFLTKKTPLYDQNNSVVGLLGISFDITDRKKSEETLKLAKEAAEAANRAKTEFVQNMQHDIRTPSAGMWGLLDSLSKSEKDPERQKVLKMAAESSKRLLDLCNDAVEFGDLEGHSKPVVEQKIDPREIARSVVELNLPAIFAKNLSFHFAVDASVPPYIKSDPFRLSRILINLLGNSVKFTEKGRISLTLKATKETGRRKGMLVIELKDTGIGISKDKITHVFEKFSRAVASNTNKYPGSGLGLYVVKVFLDELDGDIELESHEGEGSCFTLVIPFKTFLLEEGELGEIINEDYHSPLKEESPQKNNIPQIDNHKGYEEKNIQSLFNHKILIVEDDSVCLFAEKQVVSAFTSNIDTAKNMREALAYLAQKHYDLVICDLGLPDGSGAEIAVTIRNSPESPNQKTPLIAMTAHRDKEKHEEALKAGFTEVAMKPLIEDRMLHFLQSYPVEGEELDDDLEVIDLELTIKRLHAKNVKGALMGLEILSNSLKEDIPLLQQAEKQNDILGAREVLHKIRGGLYYSGTPRLEMVVAELHAAVKSVPDLNEIADKFALVYREVEEFEAYYQAIIAA